MKKFLSICLLGLILSGVEISAAFAQNTPSVKYAFALTAQRKLEVRNSIQSIKLHLQDNPKDSQKWNELGLLYSELGDIGNAQGNFEETLNAYKDAISAFDRAIKLEPKNAEFRKNRDDAVEKFRNVTKSKNKN